MPGASRGVAGGRSATDIVNPLRINRLIGGYVKHPLVQLLG